LPMSDYIVLPTLHWSQVLWANLLALGPHLWRELAGTNPFVIFWRLFLCLLKARSRDFLRIGAQLKKYGENCRIHPTAVVEACIIGSDVTIGANAVVRGCVIGNGVSIEDLALVEFSVLSEDTIIQRQAMIKFSVTSAQAAIAGVMQMGVVGENAALKRGGYLMDMSFSDGAKVMWDGEVQKAPLGLVGCCLGENSIIGLGVQVAAGRFIPPNMQIVSDPDTILQKIPNEVEGLHKVYKGGIEKL
jgi:carbonic anhydrase/acetyltransferase-like protein (isoleucine patch superfamily)